MTLKDRLDLLHAGYTKDEIEAMVSETPVENPVDTVDTPEEKPTEPETPNTPAEEKPQLDPQFAAVMESIKALTAAMQQQNINTEKQPPEAPDTVVDDLLTHFMKE